MGCCHGTPDSHRHPPEVTNFIQSATIEGESYSDSGDRPLLNGPPEYRGIEEALSLNALTLEDIDPVPHRGRRVTCSVKKVYDGDTVTILFYYGSEPMRTNIRILGIDAPEIKGRGVTDIEKIAAQSVRDYVRSLLMGEGVFVEVVMTKHDKWGGRILGDIYFAEPIVCDDRTCCEPFFSGPFPEVESLETTVDILNASRKPTYTRKIHGWEKLSDVLLGLGMVKEYGGGRREPVETRWSEEELQDIVEVCRRMF